MRPIAALPKLDIVQYQQPVSTNRHARLRSSRLYEEGSASNGRLLMVRQDSMVGQGPRGGTWLGQAPCTTSLGDPYVAAEVVKMVLGPKAELTAGSLPTLPDPPEGAIY
jgi:hypothetical protein